MLDITTASSTASYFAFFRVCWTGCLAAGFEPNSFDQNDLTSLATPIASSTVDLTSMKDSLACLYRATPSVTALTQALAAKRIVRGSTSLHPQKFLHNVGGHAWSKQDGGNDNIELNLNLLHPALATLQLLFDGFISLIADRLVDGKLLFYGVAHPVTSSAGSGVLPSASHARYCWQSVLSGAKGMNAPSDRRCTAPPKGKSLYCMVITPLKVQGNQEYKKNQPEL